MEEMQSHFQTKNGGYHRISLFGTILKGRRFRNFSYYCSMCVHSRAVDDSQC